MLALCSAPEAEIATERLARPQFGLHRVEWHDADGPSVEFHLPHGEMIRVLREAGFEIEALHELQPAADAEDALPARVARVGAAVAVRGDLGGAEALSYGVGRELRLGRLDGRRLGRREHAPLGVGERAHVGERRRLDDVRRDALPGRRLARELEHHAGLAERVLAARDRADVELAQARLALARPR